MDGVGVAMRIDIAPRTVEQVDEYPEVGAVLVDFY